MLVVLSFVPLEPNPTNDGPGGLLLSGPGLESPTIWMVTDVGQPGPI